MESEDFTPELRLSPERTLYLYQSDYLSPDLKKIARLFANHPTKGLLFLAISDFENLPPSFHFWQTFARQLITHACKLTPLESGKLESIPVPSSSDLQSLLAKAPFMRGFEYLSEEVLISLWNQLENVLQNELKNFPGGLQDYLSQYSSRWNLLGRVCFHLAENKNDSKRPFAFLATYTHQLSHNSTPQHLPLKRALQASTQEKNLLLSLLIPVQKASTSPFIKNLVDSGDIFEAKAWTIKEAYQFLKDIPLMEESGVVIRVPNWWAPQKKARIKAEVHIGENSPSMLGLSGLLDFDVKLAVGDETLTKDEWKALQNTKDHLVKIRGQWVEIDRDKLKSVLSQWNTLKQAAREGISISEALRTIAGINASDATTDEWSEVKAGTWLKNTLEQLTKPQHSLPPLSHLQATLRPYQTKGVQWLFTLYQLKLGGCLADDMGLGKTIQVLSLLLAIQPHRSSKKPHLLIVPASLLGNWEKEAERFAPTLKIHLAHSSGKESDFSNADVVLTTYGLIHRSEYFKAKEWDLVILDEAQAIKNPTSKQTRSVKSLKSEARLALTGTPIENRLGDLWSLFDFISPGLLGTDKEFSSYAKHSDKNRFMASLRKLTQPYILRRLKSDKNIISDLPDKTEMKTYCTLSKRQIQLYQEAISDLEKQLEEAAGIHRRGLILSSLMRLKQICNHPAQTLGFGEYLEEESGKMGRLREICEAIYEKQEKVLIFTQFTEIIPPLLTFLTQIFHKEGLILHGGTPVAKRAELVENFQQPQGPPFFILSLKAGGTGLNLTQASHVIHFDRWWNPAVENQATDRAYRIGQKHPVLVHQFICQGTIEEKIDALIDSKKSISKQLLEGDGEISLTELSNEQVMQMVSLDLHRALKEE